MELADRKRTVDAYLLRKRETDDLVQAQREWKPYRYRLIRGACSCCGQLVESYFEVLDISNLQADVQLKISKLCDNCTLCIPSLVMSANLMKNRYKKTYTVVGTFKEERYGKSNFTFSLKSKQKVAKTSSKMSRKNDNREFYELLQEIQNLGFKVPIFGHSYDYIAITHPVNGVVHYEENTEYVFDVRLTDWTNQNTGDSGYAVIRV